VIRPEADDFDQIDSINARLESAREHKASLMELYRALLEQHARKMVGG
jgi:hypothetical protein